MAEPVADLVIANARCVATMDGDRRELAGGWVAITGGLVEAVGTGPRAAGGDRRIDATDCLVTPGLINTHHHLFQNLTRAYPPMTDKPLFGWLQSLYPLWRGLDEEAAYLSAWVGLAELALSGCTTSTDHLYLHPRGAGDLLTAEIDGRPRPRRPLPPDPRLDVAVGEGRRAAARRRGRRRRRHPRRQRGGGAPPPRPVVRGDDPDRAGAVLAVQRHRVADGPLGRARRAARRAAAHPLRRERRGRRVLAGDVRLPARPSTSSAPVGAAIGPGWRTA